MIRLGKQTLSVWHIYYVLSLDDFVYVALVNCGNRTPQHFVSAHFHAMMDPDSVKRLLRKRESIGALHWGSSGGPGPMGQ
jgi:hypothetical protein